MAEYLGVPEEIRRRPPTTDTYSLPQSQEEFYFSLPYDQMDLCLYARNTRSAGGSRSAPVLGLSAAQVERVFRDIDSKRRCRAVSPPRRRSCFLARGFRSGAEVSRASAHDAQVRRRSRRDRRATASRARSAGPAGIRADLIEE